MAEKKYYTIEEMEDELGFTEKEKKGVRIEAKYRAFLVEFRQMRKELGYTQEMLSKKSGIPRPTISMIENGVRNVTLKTLVTLAEAMGKKLEIRFC